MPQNLIYATPKTDYTAATNIGSADMIRIETNMQPMTPLGVPMPYFFNFLPSHHLWCDGKTIGDALSGATSRANADTFYLFEGLWNSIPNAQLPIKTSTGAAGTRGASALADYNLHMRLPLPDLRGRTLIGLDNMSGTSAGVVANANADYVGGKGGEENHTLTIEEIPPHRHVINENWAYGQVHDAYPSKNTFFPTRTVSTTSVYTGYTGSNVAHNNMQPWMSVNWIIRY